MEKLQAADFSQRFDPASPLQSEGRRVFVKGVGMVSAGLLLSFFGGCEELEEAIRHRPIRRRLRVGNPEVDASIALYRQAVAAMKALSSTDPRNWASQAAIHGVFAHFNYCQHGNDHIFDWHRAYLFYFEKICQKLTGDRKFGLPYWNWNQTLDIHPAFLDTTSALFLARARTSMSGSTATLTPTLDPIFADTNFHTFRPQFEGTPHNTVHVYIGDTMGTAASALDPLFFMHHCMVDYSWYKWNVELGNNNPNDPAWVNQVSDHFVDADGNPASTTAGVTTLMPLLSYQYESSAIGSYPAVAPVRHKDEYEKLEKRIREGADVRFDISLRIRVAERAVTSIGKPLSLQTTVTPEDFARIVGSDAARERIFATIEYAHLPASSDFAVRVFVDLPKVNAATPTDDPHYAGSFAFFGTEAPGSADSAAGHMHRPSFLVDLTSTLQRLKANPEFKEDRRISLQLVPVPFGERFERENTELVLDSLDIIVTPVIVHSAPR
jgi:tyrosinase